MTIYLIKREETLYFEVEANSVDKAKEVADEANDMDYKMEVEEITNEVISKRKNKGDLKWEKI